MDAPIIIRITGQSHIRIITIDRLGNVDTCPQKLWISFWVSP